MNRLIFTGLAGVFAGVIIYFSANPALAHAVAGDRIFPATLGIDDPGVADELALPTLTFLPLNADGNQEYDVSVNFAKRITENIAVSVGDNWTHLHPGGAGWGNVNTGVKWLFFVDGAHEFMASIGVDTTWAKTGSENFSDPFTTSGPSVYFGKGFGDLPTNLNILKPFAVTGQFGLSIPWDRRTNTVSFDSTGALNLSTQLNPTFFNWGFTLQYSLPYFNSHVSEIGGPDFFKRLVPLVELTMQTPVSNTTPGARETTGYVQPGIVYMADSWQFAVEALVPVNQATGKRVGVKAELHFYLDDIFPNTLGRPLFK
jgi:hypothetical protein